MAWTGAKTLGGGLVRTVCIVIVKLVAEKVISLEKGPGVGGTKLSTIGSPTNRPGAVFIERVGKQTGVQG